MSRFMHLTNLVSSADFQCNFPLGMESRRISSEQISASSTYADGGWTAQQARLNSEDNAWAPNHDTNREYLQVCLFLREPSKM